MAGFKTHVTFSSSLGVGYAAAGFVLLDIPWPSCILAGGLCGVSGMLPDLDSGPGRPLRESMSFAAAVVPMLLLERFQVMGWPHEMMVLAAAVLYCFIRFGVAAMLRKYTVHRGMFHSVPAALIAAMVAFLLVGCRDYDTRVFKAGAVFTGFMSHLVLDEIWSINWRSANLKKSFGTAIKFWGHDLWGNVSTYAKLLIVAAIIFGDVSWTESLRHRVPGSVQETFVQGEERLEKVANDADDGEQNERIREAARKLWERLHK